MKILAGAVRSLTQVTFAFGLSCMGSAALAQAASLTLLHNNDGESKLLGSGGFGGVGYFASVVGETRGAAQDDGRDVLFISSGDNILAGLAFTASMRAGVFYDALALAKLDYDAITLGNHDFDFGPDVLADIIAGYTAAGGTAPFLSANLDVSGEPALQAHAEAGRIARSTVVECGENRYGIIAATTEMLPTVSSPRNVTVSDVLAAVQAEVVALEGQGIDKIVLSSHLQGIGSELALIPQLRGVDVVIAGGGDEYLFNLGGGDRYSDSVGGVTFGPYPLTAVDLDGRTVPVVTTIGEYRYLGRLDLEFDEDGFVTAFSGNPILVDSQAPDAAQDAALVADVIDPLIVAQDQLAANVIGSSDVPLNGRRGTVSVVGGVPTATVQGVRNAETNEGSLVADALLWRAQNTPESGLSPERRVIGLSNGGGIRNDNVLEPGEVSERTTIDILPFDNYVAVVYGVTPQALKDMLESAVSRWEFGDGRFVQIANFRFVWDPRQPATTFATPANTMTAVASAGSRVQRIEFLDGTVIYDAQSGAWYEGTIDVVTNNFTAAGGDGFSFTGNNPTVPELPRVNLPYSYQQALYDYISDEGGLNGEIGAEQYPEGGTNRIVVRFDVDGDGDADQNDVGLITAARNMPATAGYDRRDVDGNGVIDALDARQATLACSRARCAVN